MHAHPSSATAAFARSILAAFLLSPVAALAQESLTGTVSDTTGLALPGVTVEASAAGGAPRTATSDNTGSYAIGGLTAGAYDVTFTLPGFHAVVRESVEIRAGAATNLDVTLTVELAEQVVVVGSRARPRSVTSSPVPIDAIPLQDVVSQGYSTLDYQLRTLVPSFNVATHPISDAATLVRPASLRNLAHDHTLVLVNGKRRHRSSVIAWFAGVTDGAQGPDISTIPTIALRQVEVLRDGASAQYGSDAIAGVMNFLLKENRTGGSVEFNTGTYRAGDGNAYNFAGNAGIPVGDTGFVNVSLEYGNADPTNRSVQRADAAALIAAGNTDVADPAQIWGNPTIEDELKLFANFGSGGERAVEFYGHANYAQKKVTEGFYFRNPNNRANIYSLDDGATLMVGDRLWAETGVPGAGNCPAVPIADNVPDSAALAQVAANPNCFTFRELAPGGFTPQFGGEVSDASLVGGLRGMLDNGVIWDASASYGMHESDFFFLNTVNASLGLDTPREFDPGLYRQEDVNLNFDVSHAVGEIVNIAAGAEWRDERFTIGAGGRPSWEVGPYAAQGFVSGSNGFPGFPDYTSGTWTRSNVALYGDLELRDPDGAWTVGGAVRFEHFDLFGSTTNGKLSARYALTDAVAIRGGVSTGFRAPTPGQQNTLNVQTTIDPTTLQLVDSANVPSTFLAAQLKGGQPLEPETSLNTTAGLVVDTGPFTLTADYFRVDVDNRLALSQTFTLNDDERELLLSEGITSARTLQFFRFFINDFSSRNQGVDLVSTYAPPALGGGTVFSFTFNYTHTELTKESALLTAGDVLGLRRGVPRTRWNVALNQQVARVGLLARLNYYGAWVDHFDARFVRGADAPLLDGRYIVDLEATIPIRRDVTLAVGGQNVFDTFSQRMDLFADIFGLPYSQFTPWGMSGGYYYARLNYSWGS
ncbi:MAG: TonB-dependent receptor [Acidobacteria bacterium]|nr:TonB-dependent receptor [Acidobacteriota bacterium]